MLNKLLHNIFTIFLLGSLVSASYAAPTTTQLESARDKSLAYLVRQQNGDGSWGKTEGEKVRLTATVLDTFAKYGVSGVVYRRGINWLANAEAFSNDSLARQIIALNTAKIDTTALTNKLIVAGWVRATSPLTVAWGAGYQYRLSTVDSALAFQALVLRTDYANSAGINYIKSLRLSNAGWDYAQAPAAASKVIPTAQMLLTLRTLGGGHWGATVDKSAATWLAAQAKSGGAIADVDTQSDVETALAVQALGFAKDVSGASSTILPGYQNGLDYLIARQSTNGSIDNNIYKTVLAAQAWFNQNQTLTDTDGDGIPDVVETQAGTNSAVVDTVYLEAGNGNNANERSSQYYFNEVMENTTIALQLETTVGNMVKSGGDLPPGMQINTSSHILSGTPSLIGNYSFSYRITTTNGKVYVGSALIRVVAATEDTDGDGIPISYEMSYPGSLSSLNSVDGILDVDNDGLSNYQEYLINSDPTLRDTDNDGLDDFHEKIANTNARLADSDFDGVPDSYEFYNGLNPNLPDADLDLDNDGLTNYQEYLKGLPADNPDADDDGILDGIDSLPFMNIPAFIAVIYLLMN